MPYPLGHGALCNGRVGFQSQETHLWLCLYTWLFYIRLHVMQLQWWSTLCSLRKQTYLRRIRPRSRANIDEHCPQKNCLRGKIISCAFKIIMCTSCRNIKAKEIRKIARVLRFNEITKFLFYLTKVMRYYFKQNERFKLKKYDHARTRTWNLLIRSQTPYPLGHETEIGF